MITQGMIGFGKPKFFHEELFNRRLRSFQNDIAERWVTVIVGGKGL